MSKKIASKDTSFTNFITNTFKTGYYTHLPACGDLEEAFSLSPYYEGRKVYFLNKADIFYEEIDIKRNLTKLLQCTGDPLVFKGTSPVNAFAKFYHAFLNCNKTLLSYDKDGVCTEIVHEGTLLFDITEKWAYSVFGMDVPAPKTEELPHVIRRNTVKPG